MQPIYRVLLICIACYGTIASAENTLPGDPAAIESDIRVLLEASDLAIDGEDILAGDVVRQVYQDNDFKPFWADSRNIRKLISLHRRGTRARPCPGGLQHPQLHRILADRERDPTAMIEAEADLMLTESLLRYAYHRRLGKIKASTLDPDINYKRETFRNQPPSETLHEILKAPSLQDYIDLVAPSGPYYKGLQHWLHRLPATGRRRRLAGRSGRARAQTG